MVFAKRRLKNNTYPPIYKLRGKISQFFNRLKNNNIKCIYTFRHNSDGLTVLFYNPVQQSLNSSAPFTLKISWKVGKTLLLDRTLLFLKRNFDKNYFSCPLPPIQTNFSQDVPRRLRSEISKGFSENERIPILRDKPIGLIKR